MKLNKKLTILITFCLIFFSASYLFNLLSTLTAGRTFKQAGLSYGASLPEVMVLLADSRPSASSGMTVKLTTRTAISNGSFRILVPAASSGGADGIADTGYFDFGSPTVTCPNNTGAYSFSSGTATANSVTIGSQQYHAFQCSYSGSGGAGTSFDNLSNNAFVISGIINPAPATGHTEGVADIYSIIVQHLNNSGTVVDSSSTQVGVIEAVTVTATVLPQITFQVEGVSSGNTLLCGWNNPANNEMTNVTTTANTVPFGNINSINFSRAAQRLSISTNAVYGYTVTATLNDQLSLAGGSCSGDNYGSSNNCIWDANVAGMSHLVAADWSNPVNKGFAYSLHDFEESSFEAFSYNQVGNFYAKHFPDAEAGQSPVILFSSPTVADDDNLYVCYKIIADEATTPGDYWNYLTFTASASF